MADTTNPLIPPSRPVLTPVSPGMVPTPVRPVAPPVAPPLSVTPAPVTPVASVQPVQPPPISSRFLQNLQSVNPAPFQTAAAVQPTPPPVTGLPGMPPASVAAPKIPSPTSVGGVPQETAGFGLPPSGKPPAGQPVAAAAAKLPSFFTRRRNLIMAAVGGLLMLLIMIGGYLFLRPSEPEVAVKTTTPASRNVTLTYWGLWEPPEVMNALIEAYQKDHANIKITYVQQKSEQYRQRLQAAIRDGSGPDIFRYHNTWLPMLSTDLAPATTDTVSLAELRQNYYPIMAKELAGGTDVLGVPLMYEGLALLYNQSMLTTANAQPPKDWEQVRTLASQLAVRNNDRLERGGIALGTTSNVDSFSDILALMLLQNSAQPGNPVSENARHALEFYTIFSRSDKVWDETMPNSTVAFANEQVAMILAPSWRIFEIQRLNPNLQFGVTALPQLGGQRLAWSSYWVEGVSKASKNTAEAWRFLAWLSQPEQLRRFQTQAASVRGFGELYPRVDMAAELSSNKLIAPYLEDALYADSWFMASYTHDEGLDDQLIQYYTDAVNETVRTGNAQQALETILPGVQQVLSRYNISAEHQPPSAAAS